MYPGKKDQRNSRTANPTLALRLLSRCSSISPLSLKSLKPMMSRTWYDAPLLPCRPVWTHSVLFFFIHNSLIPYSYFRMQFIIIRMLTKIRNRIVLFNSQPPLEMHFHIRMTSQKQKGQNPTFRVPLEHAIPLIPWALWPRRGHFHASLYSIDLVKTQETRPFSIRAEGGSLRDFPPCWPLRAMSLAFVHIGTATFPVWLVQDGLSYNRESIILVPLIRSNHVPSPIRIVLSNSPLLTFHPIESRFPHPNFSLTHTPLRGYITVFTLKARSSLRQSSHGLAVPTVPLLFNIIFQKTAPSGTLYPILRSACSSAWVSS